MKRSTLILGGGIAGLAAAAELARNKVSVTLLEAKNRFGGRIHTIHAGNVPVELGAEFVHGQSQPLLEALREAKLSTLAVPEQNRVFTEGRFETVDIWKIVGEIFHRVNPRAPDVPFEDFLAKAANEPVKTYTRHFVEGFEAADPRRIGAHALLRQQCAAEHMNGSKQLRVARGYSALVDFLTAQIESLGGILSAGTAVRSVAWKEKNVEVSALHDDRLKRFVADGAIVALPLGVLQSNEIRFAPLLPEKLAAAREMQFGNVVRIVFMFRERFWEDFGFIQAFDEPIPTWWSDSRGPILTGWAGGPRADAILKLSHAQLEALGLKIIGKLFPGEAVRHQFLASHYWNWTEDPFIRGGYSYIPVNGLDLPKRLAEPVANTLFFAGEATVSDAQTGTVFGALETGLRAAAEFLQAN